MTLQLRPDPRGTRVLITSVDWRKNGVTLTYDCGHTGEANQIFSYEVGSGSRCFTCGKENLAEFLKEANALWLKG